MERKILVADDHALIRNGIIGIIESLGYSDVMEAESLSSILKVLTVHRGEITHGLFDLKLTDGIILEKLSFIKKINPEISIAIISMNRPDIYQKPLMKFGIEYYLTKTATDDEMRDFIRRFLNNEPYPRHKISRDFSNPFSKLTEAEHAVLNYMLEGKGTKEIAVRRDEAQGSVSTLKRRIFEKTGTDNEIELFQLALSYDIS